MLAEPPTIAIELVDRGYQLRLYSETPRIIDVGALEAFSGVGPRAASIIVYDRAGAQVDTSYCKGNADSYHSWEMSSASPFPRTNPIEVRHNSPYVSKEYQFENLFTGFWICSANKDRHQWSRFIIKVAFPIRGGPTLVAQSPILDVPASIRAFDDPKPTR